MSTELFAPSERFRPNPMPCGYSRRSFLWEVGGGFTGMVLTSLLARDGFFAHAAEPTAPLAIGPHFKTKAKYCIFLYMARQATSTPSTPSPHSRSTRARSIKAKRR